MWKLSPPTGVRATIFRNVAWSLASKVVSLIGALLVGIMVARYLGPTQYGLMNYVVSFNCLFLIIATFGFENIEIREEAKHNDCRDKIIGTTFVMRVALSIVTILLIWLVAYINESDRYTFYLIMIYSAYVIMTPFDVIRNYFTSQVQNEYIAKVGIGRTVFSCLLKLLLLWLHASLTWFVVSLVVDAAVLAQGYCFVYHQKHGKMRSWTFDMRWAKYILRQSFPLLISGAAAMVFLWIDQIMIGNMIDKTSVGYFSVATKFVEILIYVPTVLIQTVCPLLVKLKKEDTAEYEKKAQLFLNITVWLCALMAIAVSLCSYYIVTLTFGMQYANAVAVLQILAFKIVGVALNNVSGQILIIDGKQDLFVLRSLSGCLACIALNYLVIPVYGITGVACVAIVTQLVAGFLIHSVIPQYRYVFKMQLNCVFTGWKDLSKFKSLVVHNK